MGGLGSRLTWRGAGNLPFGNPPFGNLPFGKPSILAHGDPNWVSGTPTPPPPPPPEAPLNKLPKMLGIVENAYVYSEKLKKVGKVMSPRAVHQPRPFGRGPPGRV